MHQLQRPLVDLFPASLSLGASQTLLDHSRQFAFPSDTDHYLTSSSLSASLTSKLQCAGTSSPCLTSTPRSALKRFELLHSSSCEKSAVSTNRRRRTKPHFWRRWMASPASRPVFSVHSKPTRFQRIEKKRPLKPKLAPLIRRAFRNWCPEDSDPFRAEAATTFLSSSRHWLQFPVFS
jgi:hypothetical protein